jgi:hypothetical protein
MFFELIRVETGKWGVGGYSTRLEPAHMVKAFDKIGGHILVLIRTHLKRVVVWEIIVITQ